VDWGKVDWNKTKIDLDKVPGFREHKSTTDKKLYEIDQRARAVEQRAQRAEWERQQIAQQLEAKMMEGQDDYTKLEFQHTKLASENRRLQDQLAEIQQTASRNQFVAAVKDEFGVDLSNKNFKDPSEAMLMVAKLQREKVAEAEKKVQTWERRNNGNAAAAEEKMDLGGGIPMGLNALQRQYDDAMIKKNGTLADRLSRQAAEEGVKLDRFAWIANRSVRDAI
jgi:hypothetical protein